MVQHKNVYTSTLQYIFFNNSLSAVGCSDSFHEKIDSGDEKLMIKNMEMDDFAGCRLTALDICIEASVRRKDLGDRYSLTKLCSLTLSCCLPWQPRDHEVSQTGVIPLRF